VPRLFTRIECGVFGVDEWIGQLPPSTHLPILPPLYLSQFASLRERNLRPIPPAKHVLSNVEGTPSSRRPLHPTAFLRGPYIDFSDLGALCAFAGE